MRTRRFALALAAAPPKPVTSNSVTASGAVVTKVKGEVFDWSASAIKEEP